jgi:hypothetical protein
MYKIVDSGWVRTRFLLNLGIVISVTWLITLEGGGGEKTTMGIRDFNLRNSRCRKREE